MMNDRDKFFELHLRALNATMGKVEAYLERALPIYRESIQYGAVFRDPRLRDVAKTCAKAEISQEDFSRLIQMAYELAATVKRTGLRNEGFSDDDIQLAEELGMELYEEWKQS